MKALSPGDMPKIVGMAYFLPSRRVDNRDLEEDLGLSAAEIQRRTGVRSRRYAEEGTGPSDLACEAARIALAEAGMTPKDVEFLIFATMTPDVAFPGSGCYLQDKLGCRTVGALDLRAQCCGFLFALEVAEQFVRAGKYRRVLVAAAEVHSSGLDFSPRGAAVTPLFGDGAATVVVDSEGEGLLGSVIHTDATRFEQFWCELPTSRRPPARFLTADLPLGKHYPHLDAETVRREGVAHIRSAIEEVLACNGIRAEQVSRFFVQHVFRDAAFAALDALGVLERATVGGDEEGHVAAASLPISLCQARERGQVKSGDIVCMATAGAGMNRAAALVRL
jgi:3-oxoacyl-[acyl-carrier-protein] synthase-3